MALTPKQIALFVAAAIPVISVVAGGVWGSLTYLHGKRLEYQKTFNDKQLEIVMLVAQTVGDLTATENEQEWKLTRARFWELYWGRLVLFEDDAVVKAMVDFGNKLNVASFEKRADIKYDSYNVSVTLRKFLQKKNDEDWKITFSELKYGK